MIILPAIDIHDGKCVRLYKGDFETAEQVADSYMDTARQFESCGAEWIHMVDLDGAKNGEPVNTEIFVDVAKNTNLKVELGGGIRSLDTVEYYLSKGISRVILGSVALKNPELVKTAVKEFHSKIAVGIDAKDGLVSTEGWLDDSSEVTYIDLAKEMASIGVRYMIYTDISKDGTLTGVNVAHLDNLNRNVRGNIIASGGVRSIKDIKECKRLGLYGVICGKSIYKGTLNLRDAVEVSKK